MKIISQLAFVFVMILSLSSCNGNEEVVMNSVDNQWNKNKVQEFDVNIANHQSPKNLIFVVRNNNSYPFSNIRLIASLEQGKKVLSVDTLNYILAKPNGEWLGKGVGEVKETQFIYKSDYKFPSDGSYSIKVLQAMRENVLPGIEDIGLKIQDIKP